MKISSLRGLEHAFSDRPGISANKIKDLNNEYNVTMYSSKVREGKAFAAERAMKF